MKKSQQDLEDEKETLLPQDKKYPTVSKWKKATIVITILCVIFLTIDIVLVVYVGNHQPRNINYTFVADLLENLKDTAITPLQFANMMGALTQSYQDIWFQEATPVDSWSSSDPSGLTLSRVIDFFTTKVENRITLICFNTSATTSLVVGAFTHVPFKVPNTWSEYLPVANSEYFTFQIDDRQSTLIGGNSPTYLKMNGNDQNLINCKIINLSQQTLTFFEGIDITLQSPAVQNSPYLTFLDLGEMNAKCFTSNSQTGAYLDWLKLGAGDIKSNTPYKMTNIITYQLSIG